MPQPFQISQSYRLLRGTIAILPKGEHMQIVNIPANEIVTVKDVSRRKDKMLTVSWNNLDVSMFMVDLQERGEQVQSAIGATVR